MRDVVSTPAKEQVTEKTNQIKKNASIGEQ